MAKHKHKQDHEPEPTPFEQSPPEVHLTPAQQIEELASSIDALLGNYSDLTVPEIDVALAKASHNAKIRKMG